MTSPTNTIDESLLHAYVDQALSDQEQARVAAWLAEHPEALSRVQAYRETRQALHNAFDPVTEEPVPEHLKAIGNRSKSSASPKHSFFHRLHALSPSHIVKTIQSFSVNWKTAAITGWLAFGLLSGWQWIPSLHSFSTEPLLLTESRSPASNSQNLVRDLLSPAVFAHQIYTSDHQYPVEITATQTAELDQWLSLRLHTDISTPDLNASGIAFLGGRLLPSTDRMAGQLMYETAQGERITLYLRRGFWQQTKTAMQMQEKAQNRIVYWIQGNFAYAVVGAVTTTQLQKIADALQKQLV